MSFVPYAEYRDSGVEWVGEIPCHWKVTQIKRVASIRYGIGEPPKYQETGIPLIRATNVDAGHIRYDGMVYINPEDLPESRIIWLKSGDIIVVRSGAYTGDSAIVRDENCPCIAGFGLLAERCG
jgi:type I restriction enzyme S subunit